ncbi:hypothetical protein [Nocardioides sp. Soil805]|uniref:hypothetical protein n=1 Tax=Nocardioides sp. Soil805 TaxID=1736416 RepID=UPI0007031019|nr:hypothetical protein [Nocardioides sp. Soil805]KRF34382.1 hypothetical protein ASG94_16940 [Nocardioides sp. Soil805]
MNLKADLDALTADANLWSASSDTLSSASTSASGLTIPAYAFSFAGGDVHAKYEEVRAWVEKYLSEGSKEQEGASKALIKIRDDFTSTDEAQRDQYQGMWDPQ